MTERHKRVKTKGIKYKIQYTHLRKIHTRCTCKSFLFLSLFSHRVTEDAVFAEISLYFVVSCSKVLFVYFNPQNTHTVKGINTVLIRVRKKKDNKAVFKKERQTDRKERKSYYIVNENDRDKHQLRDVGEHVFMCSVSIAVRYVLYDISISDIICFSLTKNLHAGNCSVGFFVCLFVRLFCCCYFSDAATFPINYSVRSRVAAA